MPSLPLPISPGAAQTAALALLALTVLVLWLEVRGLRRRVTELEDELDGPPPPLDLPALDVQVEDDDFVRERIGRLN